MNATPKKITAGRDVLVRPAVQSSVPPPRRAAFDGHDERQAQRKKEIERLYGPQVSL